MLAESYLPLIGGAELHIYYLTRELLKLNHDIRLFTNTIEDCPSDFPVTRVPWKPSLQGLLNHHQKLTGFCSEANLVHSHYSHRLSAMAVPVCKKLRLPLVLTLHGLGTLDREYYPFFNRLTYKFFRRYSLEAADAIISTSPELTGVAQRFAPKEKVFDIPNGVDTALFAPPRNQARKASSERIVLAVRRLVPKTGIQFLVEAIPGILREAPETRFVIIGDGPLAASLKQRVLELGVNEHVSFRGAIQNEDLTPFFAQADVVVFPSSAESTSLSCLEAMSMQKAVVASAVGAFPGLLGDDERGMLVDLFDSHASNYLPPASLPVEKINALSEAIAGLLGDDARKSRLGRAAREYVVKNHDWGVIAKKTLEVYESVM